VGGENDPSLVRCAGLAVSGELARRLVQLIGVQLRAERRARQVKVRRRRLSPGRLGGGVAGVAAGRWRVLLRTGGGPRRSRWPGAADGLGDAVGLRPLWPTGHSLADCGVPLDSGAMAQYTMWFVGLRSRIPDTTAINNCVV